MIEVDTISFFFRTETAEELKAIAEQNTPHFIIRLHDTEVMESTFLRFMLKVNGEPRPKIQLYVIQQEAIQQKSNKLFQ